MRAPLILLLLMMYITGQAQSYYFSHYQVDEGLTHNTVVTILQDSKGFMWLGTKGGLCRFDGYTFRTYRNKANNFGPIGNNVILSICEDRQGTMWIGTGRGGFKYDTHAEVLQELPLNTYASISYILPDGNDHLWLLSNGALLHYDKRSNTVDTTRLSGICMSQDSHMNLWLGHTDGSLLIYDPKKRTRSLVQIIPASLPPNLRQISRIFPVNDSLVLIGTTKQGLKSYNPLTGDIRSLLTRNNDSTEIYVRDIVTSGKDEYWVATESGIYIYNTRTNISRHLQKSPGDEYSLTDNAVYALCRDNQGGLWAGTFFGGLNYYSPENARFEKYYPLQNTNSIAGNAVREICSDNDNNIWIGTEDAGVNKLDVRTGKFTDHTTNGKTTGLSYPNIHGLLVVGNRLFTGPFQHGMEIMDINTGRVIDRFRLFGEPGSMRNDFVMSIHLTKDSTLLIGTTGEGGLFSYDIKKRRFTKCRLVPSDTYVYAIMEDHEGNIWTGSLERGSFWFNPHTGKSGNITFTDKARRNPQVQGIFEDSRHTIWFATEGGGLFKLSSDRKTLKKFTTLDGLPTNNIFRILEDNDQHLWISSLKGLICLDLATEKFKVYTRANGLLTDQFNYNSAFKDRSGKMYFGTVKGMISFDPARFGKSPYVPPTYITGFQVNDRELGPDTPSSPLKRSITCTDTIILHHDQSNFSIEFAALNYSSPTVTRYRYFMKGLDKDWTYLNSNRKAYFTDLSPGNYTFIVQAESNVGTWTGKETRLFIRILPPIWKSAGAYIFYLVCIALILWLSVRYYHRYHKNKTLNKLRLFRHEKEKEIYQARIEFFTNIAHEIQTPLTLILGPLELLIKKIDELPSIKKNLLMMNKNGQRLLELTNQLLDFRRTEVDQFGLSFVNTVIPDLLHERIDVFRPEAEKAGITIATGFPDPHFEAFVDREAFIKICDNLLSNAIKYGSSNISISMPSNPSSGQSFIVRFINDGKGIPLDTAEKIFEPFFRLPHNDKPGTGIGLSLARSLAELHNGTLHLVSGETGRIIFELTLPVHQKIEFQLSKWKNIPQNEGHHFDS